MGSEISKTPTYYTDIKNLFDRYAEEFGFVRALQDFFVTLQVHGIDKLRAGDRMKKETEGNEVQN